MRRLLTSTLMICGCAAWAYAQEVEPRKTIVVAPVVTLTSAPLELRPALFVHPTPLPSTASQPIAPLPPTGISVTIVAKQQDEIPAIIAIKGPIIIGDDKKFHAATDGITKAVVFLESRGGSLGAATNIGLAIRAKGFQTAVSNNTMCASACALAWLGGLTRFAGESARIGFHSAKYPDNYQKTHGAAPFTSDPNAGVERYLNKLGMRRTAFLYVTQADPKHMTWLSGGDTIHGIFFEPLAGTLATRTTQK